MSAARKPAIRDLAGIAFAIGHGAARAGLGKEGLTALTDSVWPALLDLRDGRAWDIAQSICDGYNAAGVKVTA